MSEQFPAKREMRLSPESKQWLINLLDIDYRSGFSAMSDDSRYTVAERKKDRERLVLAAKACLKAIDGSPHFVNVDPHLLTSVRKLTTKKFAAVDLDSESSPIYLIQFSVLFNLLLDGYIDQHFFVVMINTYDLKEKVLASELSFPEVTYWWNLLLNFPEYFLQIVAISNSELFTTKEYGFERFMMSVSLALYLVLQLAQNEAADKHQKKCLETKTDVETWQRLLNEEQENFDRIVTSKDEYARYRVSIEQNIEKELDRGKVRALSYDALLHLTVLILISLKEVMEYDVLYLEQGTNSSWAILAFAIVSLYLQKLSLNARSVVPKVKRKK